MFHPPVVSKRMQPWLAVRTLLDPFASLVDLNLSWQQFEPESAVSFQADFV